MTDDQGSWLAALSDGAGFDAALFDLDGVLTPTAEVHMLAWQAMFDDYFASRDITPPYTSADYFAHVDGKPRYDGVRSCLASRSFTIPEGDPSDPPGTETVCGLGNTKNEMFDRMLREDGVTAYPGSLALLDELVARGVKMAVVSSSRNAPDVLAAAGIADLFPVVVDGTVAGNAGSARQAVRGHLRVCRAAAGRPGRAGRRARGRRVGRGGGARRRLRARRRRRPRRRRRRRSRRPARPSSSRTSPSWSAGEGRSATARAAGWARCRSSSTARASPSTPGGSPSGTTASGDLGVTETLFAVGQRLPRPARQRRGGPGHLQPRDVRQRLPRDLAHPPRRGGLRLRPDRADDRRRPRRQGHPALRRRRAAPAVRGGPAVLRAHPRLLDRGAHPGPRLAHPGREPGPRPLAADGVVHPAPSGRDDVRGHPARQDRPGDHLLAGAQPRGRDRRVRHEHGAPVRHGRPAQGRGVRGSGPPAHGPLGRRPPGVPRLPVHELQDDPCGRRRPHHRDRQRGAGRSPRPPRTTPRTSSGCRPSRDSRSGSPRPSATTRHGRCPRASSSTAAVAPSTGSGRRASRSSSPTRRRGSTASGSAPTSSSRASRRPSRPSGSTSSSSPRPPCGPRGTASRRRG